MCDNKPNNSIISTSQSSAIPAKIKLDFAALRDRVKNNWRRPEKSKTKNDKTKPSSTNCTATNLSEINKMKGPNNAKHLNKISNALNRLRMVVEKAFIS
jgi:hypothetical protein